MQGQTSEHAVLKMHDRGAVGVEQVGPDEGEHAAGHERCEGVGCHVDAKGGGGPVGVERWVGAEHEERPGDRKTHTHTHQQP